MRPPVIPETVAICAVCKEAFAMQGKGVCCDCLLETRFAAWALADGEAPSESPRVFGEQRCTGVIRYLDDDGGELPPGVRYVGDVASGGFVPAVPVGLRPCSCGCGRQDPVYEAAGFATPRITEVAASLPASAERTAHAMAQARRYALRVGWLVLVAFTCGWLFARSGC